MIITIKPFTWVNKIICGDNVSILKKIPGETFDCCVTSPPYDEMRDYTYAEWNFENLAQQLYRVMKAGSVIVWVVNDATVQGSESGTSFKQVLRFKEIGFNLHDTMIYYKGFAKFPDKTRYGQSFEYMFVLSKGKVKTFNPIKVPAKQAGMYKNSTDRTKEGDTKAKSFVVNDLKTKENVWLIDAGYNRSSKDKIAFDHPAIFPEALAQDHILSWTNPDDLILDPFCGSGTTAKMCLLNNRKFTGIEKSIYYVDSIIKPRLKQYGYRD